MNAREVIRDAINTANMISTSYLGDLTDADLLVRPVPGANHIAWQLGHLIVSEHGMIEAVRPGSMPALPADFAEKYTKDTAALDTPGAFHSKADYLRLLGDQRAATLRVLGALTDADLDQPGPEMMREYAPRVSDVFLMQSTHWMMHAGQWAIVRRKLGRKPLF